ncbi:hypothetical protein [Paracoccus sp. ME4]|uniref:hypothetical protein n=1 Tax=Paracoccus sp. ME4 TaxID=3138066 RepID=UPI00398B02A4
MRLTARIIGLGLSAMTLAAADRPAGPACTTRPGADAALSERLCAALRDAAGEQAVRLEVIATGPDMLSARIARGTGAFGPRLDFTMTDRSLRPDDFSSFAHDLLRFGLVD